jgi:hypothetical protein
VSQLFSTEPNRDQAGRRPLKIGTKCHIGLSPKSSTTWTSRATATLFARSSLLLCLLFLVLNVVVGLAQEPSPVIRQSERNIARLDRARRLAYHTRFLREVAKSSPLIEVVWDLEKVYPSLRFIAEKGSDKDNQAAKAVVSIFERTEDILARDLSLAALKKIGNKVAKREMLRIYNDTTVAAKWRTTCAEYLGMPSPQSSRADSPPGSHTKISP